MIICNLCLRLKQERFILLVCWITSFICVKISISAYQLGRTAASGGILFESFEFVWRSDAIIPKYIGIALAPQNFRCILVRGSKYPLDIFRPDLLKKILQCGCLNCELYRETHHLLRPTDGHVGGIKFQVSPNTRGNLWNFNYQMWPYWTDDCETLAVNGRFHCRC